MRTKILADEPQPMRAFVKVANWLMGVPVEKSGEELAWAVADAAKNERRDGYYSRPSWKGVRRLKDESGDADRVWALAEHALVRWR